MTATVNGINATADVQFGADLPTGFIAYAGDNRMNWSRAKSYCATQGGKIPLINDSSSWDGTGTWSVDGFGSSTSRWPSGWSGDFFWAGTEISTNPDHGWIVGDNGGYVNVYDSGDGGYGTRVVCVPLP